MNYSLANELADLLEVRWPALKHDRPRFLGALMEQADEFGVRKGVAALIDGWSNRRAPTVLDLKNAIKKAIESERGRDKFRECDERKRDLTMKYTETMLAMNARYADEVCADCVDEYCGARGVSPDDPLLRHKHFTIYELDDPALMLAVAGAKKAMPQHALEAKAKPETESSIAFKRERIKALIGGFLRPAPAAPVAILEPPKTAPIADSGW